MKETKRKTFKFYRSYYDIFNELENDSDKLDFISALLDKQFLGKDPQLKGIVKFAFISQLHSIEKQVKGWQDATGQELTGGYEDPKEDPLKGGNTHPLPEVKVKEEEEVKEEEKEKEHVLISSLSEKSELSENGFIAFSFWQLFKKNMKELGKKNTTNLDKAKLSKWENEIRLMIENDKATKDELQIVWKFLNKSHFWKSNVLSVNKLRKQFETLVVKANAENINPIKKQPGSEADEWMRNKLNQLANEQRNN